MRAKRYINVFVKNISECAKNKVIVLNTLEDIKITPFFNIDSINMDNCAKQGKLILKGSFSDDIDLSIKFDLLLTYPLEEMKCEIDKPKKNEQVEVVCKVHIGFYSVETFIIEEKIIHKKNKELFIIKRKEILHMLHFLMKKKIMQS